MLPKNFKDEYCCSKLNTNCYIINRHLLIFQYEINPCLHQNEYEKLFLNAQFVTKLLFPTLRFFK